MASRSPGTNAPVALILGDQLSPDNPALVRALSEGGSALMIEAPGESTRTWSHKARIVMFLSAMRHFAQSLEAQSVPLDYISLEDEPQQPALAARLAGYLRRKLPSAVLLTEPGDWRISREIARACSECAITLEVLPDPHFLVTTRDFARWAADRRTLRMEHFYRHVRRDTGILMEGDEPVGGRWNFDAENRKGFGPAGPAGIGAARRFEPDTVTREVIALVARAFPDHPGSLESFAWPVTRAAAVAALEDFVATRLAAFGPHQDAMWTGEPFLAHSLLSAALNLKLLDPREVIAAALQAYRDGLAPLQSVEGFVRQVLGWREFIRGVYWLDMPGLAGANHFGHHRPLPAWFWTGDTHMNCLRSAIGQTLTHGYAHHIQRLMVIGNFSLLAGLEPGRVSDWFLAIYVDAVEWVELPNTIGMALYADGGRFTSKPYVASGAYTDRMSNYCKGCRYSVRDRSGPRACPITLLYWNFLVVHEQSFLSNPRTRLMARNLSRLDAEARRTLRRAADRTLESLDTL